MAESEEVSDILAAIEQDLTARNVADPGSRTEALRRALRKPPGKVPAGEASEDVSELHEAPGSPVEEQETEEEEPATDEPPRSWPLRLRYPT